MFSAEIEEFISMHVNRNSVKSRKKYMTAHQQQWYAFYVKPRHEKKASVRLGESYEIFCPLKEERVQWSDRWKTVTRPYIPGYIFAKVAEKERLAVLEDPSIFRTVCYKGRPCIIRAEELEAIKRVIGNPNAKDIKLEAIEPGDHVLVTGGRFINLNGLVVAMKGNRAVLRIDSLHCNITFALRRSLLKKCT